MRRFPMEVTKKYPDEFGVFRKLNTPAKVQDFLNTLKINFQDKRETCWSPLEVLRHKSAHCMEGAMLAAAIFWYHGRPPLLLDLVTHAKDDDHVVALFKEGNRWGAVSKTNHAVLRYRDPVFRDVRELAMSYFSEYFLNDGMKTMRTFSKPFDLSVMGNAWLTATHDLFAVPRVLDRSPHVRVVTSAQVRTLRHADPIERRAGKLTEEKRRS